VQLAINGRTPAYLKDLIKTTASAPAERLTAPASNNDLVIQQTRLNVPSLSLGLASGTNYLLK
jgi:hypothetical protein